MKNFIKNFQPYFFVIIGALLIVAWQIPLLGDEIFHYPRIISIVHQTFEVEWGTTSPAYHYMMAFFIRLIGIDSINLVRFINSVFGLLAVYIFSQMLTKDDDNKIIKITTFALTPIIFPYFFLVYTDTLSLLLVLAFFYLNMKGKAKLAGLFGILAAVIRQNNIVWLLYPIMLEVKRIMNTTSAKERDMRGLINICVHLLKRFYVHILGFLGFGVFVYLNQGVAFGDKYAHPTSGIYFGNIFFFLFVTFVILAPTILEKIKNTSFSLKHLLIIAIFAITYLTLFNVDHYHNLENMFFIRNVVLTTLKANLGLKIIGFAPIFLAALYLFKLAKENTDLWFIYLLTFIFLSQSWLIEQRYYIIPISLIMALGIRKVSKIQMTYSLILTILVLWGMLTNSFFL